jgi:hypothetical protein
MPMNNVALTDPMRNVMANLLRGDSVRVTVSDSGYPQSVMINGLQRAVVGSTVQGLIDRGYVELGEAVEGVCNVELTHNDRQYLGCGVFSPPHPQEDGEGKEVATLEGGGYLALISRAGDIDQIPEETYHAMLAEGIGRRGQGQQLIALAIYGIRVRQDQLPQFGPHPNFLEIIAQRYDYNRAAAYRYAQAGKVLWMLLDAGIPAAELPSTLTHMVELDRLPPERLADVWRKILNGRKALPEPRKWRTLVEDMVNEELAKEQEALAGYKQTRIPMAATPPPPSEELPLPPPGGPACWDRGVVLDAEVEAEEVEAEEVEVEEVEEERGLRCLIPLDTLMRLHLLRIPVVSRTYRSGQGGLIYILSILHPDGGWKVLLETEDKRFFETVWNEQINQNKAIGVVI